MRYELSMTVVIDTPTHQGATLRGNVEVPTEWVEAFNGNRDEIIVSIVNKMLANRHVEDPRTGEDVLLYVACLALTSEIGPSIKNMPIWPVDLTLVITNVTPDKCDWTLATQDYESYLADQIAGANAAPPKIEIVGEGRQDILYASHRTLTGRVTHHQVKLW